MDAAIDGRTSVAGAARGGQVSPAQTGLDWLMADLSAVLYADQSIAQLLDRVADAALRSVEDLDAVSVTVRTETQGRLATMVASSEAARRVDAVQYEERSGPCVEATATGAEVTETFPTTRWAEVSEAAVDAGIHAVWSIPLRAGGQVWGALNLYSESRPPWQYSGGGAPWQAPTAASARLLAGQAAVVLANGAAMADTERRNAQLQQALETRTVIAMAQGIIMGRQTVGAEEAFDVLRRASQRTNRKVRDLAEEMVSRFRTPGPG